MPPRTPPRLQTLPPEIQEHVLLSAPAASARVLGQTCRAFRALATDAVVRAKQQMKECGIWTPWGRRGEDGDEGGGDAGDGLQGWDGGGGSGGVWPVGSGADVSVAAASTARRRAWERSATGMHGGGIGSISSASDAAVRRGRARRVTKEQWLSLAAGRGFDGTVARAVLEMGCGDPTFVSVAAEHAAMHGDGALLEFLLAGGQLDGGQRNQALVQSSLCGHTGLVWTLLEAGADVRADHSAALSMAAKYGHAAAVAALLASGADVHADDDYALAWAARNGHGAVVDALLAAGASVHARRGCALQWAAEHGHEHVVGALLAAGADVHSSNDYALRWAAVRGQAGAVGALLAAGADVHAADDFAVRNAAKFGWAAVVRQLVAAGADVRACDDEAAKWVLAHGNSEMRAVLAECVPALAGLLAGDGVVGEADEQHAVVLG